MIEISIDGSGAEGFAGIIDYKTYRYFIDNNISINKYNEQIEFGFSMAEEDKMAIPEEHDFGASGLFNFTDLWSYGGADLNDEAYITVSDDNFDTIWQSNLDPYNLESAGVKLIKDGSSWDILEGLSPGSAAVYGTRYEEGNIFKTEIEDVDDFDPSKLTIYYHEDDDEGQVIKKITYDNRTLRNDSGDATVFHSSYSLFANEYESESDSDTSMLDTESNNSDEVEITEPAMVIRVSRGYSEDMTPNELYDITRSAWKVSLDRANNVEYVLSVYEGAVKEVYRVAGWHEAGATFVPKREDFIDSGRFEFVGTIAEDSVRDKYLNKSVKYLFKPGNAQPVMYLNC